MGGLIIWRSQIRYNSIFSGYFKTLGIVPLWNKRECIASKSGTQPSEINNRDDNDDDDDENIYDDDGHLHPHRLRRR